MPAPPDSDAPNIDARYAQSLTINITYHTGMIQTLFSLGLFIYSPVLTSRAHSNATVLFVLRKPLFWMNIDQYASGYMYLGHLPLILSKAGVLCPTVSLPLSKFCLLIIVMARLCSGTCGCPSPDISGSTSIIFSLMTRTQFSFVERNYAGRIWMVL